MQNELNYADWTTKREIIRALVQRIEIGQKKVAVVLRRPTDAGILCSANYGDIVTGVKLPQTPTAHLRIIVWEGARRPVADVDTLRP